MTDQFDLAYFNKTNSTGKFLLDIENYKYIELVDYRVGCAICQKGQSKTLKTNIVKILDSNNSFQLNELSIEKTWLDDLCKDDDTINFNYYWETTDSKTIKELYNYYNKFTNILDENDIYRKINFNVKKNMWIDFGRGGITSVYHVTNENISNIKSSYICACCYSWLILIDENYSSKFVKKNPLEYYWKDHIRYYILLDKDIQVENSQKILEWCEK
jgi:hypothetical protein